ncbi:MAG: HepT-like ribonuclease domain-containing protein [Anaerolineae bacterium]
MSVDFDRLIKQKLTNIASYVEEITPYLQVPVKGYLKDSGRRRIVERLSQVIIESAIDTNGLLIERAGNVPPATAYRSFDSVHRLGAIDDQLTARFHRYVGLRNRIVHDYDVLDNRIVYYSAKRLLDDAKQYIRSVYAYLPVLSSVEVSAETSEDQKKG